MAKGPEAFRTISEAADELSVPQHVLRFWETKFSFIRPMKRAGGRRFYRPQDIAVLRGVRTAAARRGLHHQGRAAALHTEQGVKRTARLAVPAGVGDRRPAGARLPHGGNPTPSRRARSPSSARTSPRQVLAEVEACEGAGWTPF